MAALYSFVQNRMFLGGLLVIRQSALEIDMLRFAEMLQCPKVCLNDSQSSVRIRLVQRTEAAMGEEFAPVGVAAMRRRTRRKSFSSPMTSGGMWSKRVLSTSMIASLTDELSLSCRGLQK